MTWDSISISVVIGLAINGIINIINAIFSGLASIRSGRIDTKIDKQDGVLDGIHRVTNSVLESSKNKNEQLTSEKEELYKNQIAIALADKDKMMNRIADLEKELVKKAEAIIPRQEKP